jgi:hypothetical protein
MQRLRQILAVAAVLASLCLIVAGHWTKRANVDSSTSMETRPYNDATKAALDLRVDQAKSLFQLGILVAAAILGLLIAKPDEGRLALQDWPELVMLACGLTLLAFSLAFHTMYLDSISAAYKAAGATCFLEEPRCIPDVFAAAINDLFKYQERFLLGGTVLSLATLFSAHRLKEKK